MRPTTALSTRRSRKRSTRRTNTPCSRASAEPSVFDLALGLADSPQPVRAGANQRLDEGRRQVAAPQADGQVVARADGRNRGLIFTDAPRSLHIACRVCNTTSHDSDASIATAPVHCHFGTRLVDASESSLCTATRRATHRASSRKCARLRIADATLSMGRDPPLLWASARRARTACTHRRGSLARRGCSRLLIDDRARAGRASRSISRAARACSTATTGCNPAGGRGRGQRRRRRGIRRRARPTTPHPPITPRLIPIYLVRRWPASG